HTRFSRDWSSDVCSSDLGDLNSDPVDGDSWPGAIEQLLRHPRVQDPKPTSDGAVEAAETQGGANAGHGGEARYDTADFAEPTPRSEERRVGKECRPRGSR